MRCELARELVTQLRDHLPLGLGRHRASLTSVLPARSRRAAVVRPGRSAGLEPLRRATSQGARPTAEVGRCHLPRRARRRPPPSPSRGHGRSGPADQAPADAAAFRPVTRPRAQAVCGDPSSFSCQATRRATRAMRRTARRPAMGRSGRRSGRLRLRGDREDAGDVDPDAGAHRARDGQRLQVLALGAGRLRAVDGVEQRWPGSRPAGPPRSCALPTETWMIAALVDLELDAARLDLADAPGRGRT